MAGDDVQEIKSKLDIVEVIADYVSLKRNGKTWWGRCPFHNEKTPSFAVSPDRQTFHCFGCGKGGDVFTFIMEMEHIEFREALEKLAERTGVKLQVRSGRNTEAVRTLGNINVCALDFFRRSLAGSGGEAARAYLTRRVISRESASRFELGWAPASWNSLIRQLKSSGFSEAQIEESGLVAKSERGVYDRFRGRVMFPIYSITDRLIGFGGRIIDGEGAKYLNSPESPLFNKRNNLYLLNKAKAAVREKGFIILTEGYMDAIRCHLSGYTNTVASLGTSLTEAQAALIKRMAGLCYICYDSDAAGQEASLRGMYILQQQGVSVKIVRLSGGKDPDEILLQDGGRELFEKALREAMALPVYHAVLRSGDLRVPEKSQAARDDLFDGLASLPLFDVEPYLDKIGEILGVFSHEVRDEIASRQEKIRGRNTRPLPDEAREAPDDAPEPEEEEPADDLECVFCSLLWGDAELRASLARETIIPFMTDLTVQNIITALMSGEPPTSIEARWRQMGDTRGLGLIARGNGFIAKENLNSEAAIKILQLLRKRCIEKRMKALLSKMTRGTATEEEQMEYQRMNRILKGGRFGS